MIISKGKKSKSKIKNRTYVNVNENSMYQNTYTAKSVLKWKFISVRSYLKNKEKKLKNN